MDHCTTKLTHIFDIVKPLLLLLKSLYITRVRPILEYGASIWDPYLQKDIDCLEHVQKFATKICARNWSLPYEDRLKLLQLPSLALRRKVAKLCFLYKILNNQATAPFPLTPINHCHFIRSHDLCLRNSHARSNRFLNSFFNSTIRLWNRLPHAIVHADSANIFKNAVSITSINRCVLFCLHITTCTCACDCIVYIILYVFVYVYVMCVIIIILCV